MAKPRSVKTDATAVTPAAPKMPPVRGGSTTKAMKAFTAGYLKDSADRDRILKDKNPFVAMVVLADRAVANLSGLVKNFVSSGLNLIQNLNDGISSLPSNKETQRLEGLVKPLHSDVDDSVVKPHKTLIETMKDQVKDCQEKLPVLLKTIASGKANPTNIEPPVRGIQRLVKATMPAFERLGLNDKHIREKARSAETQVTRQTNNLKSEGVTTSAASLNKPE